MGYLILYCFMWKCQFALFSNLMLQTPWHLFFVFSFSSCVFSFWSHCICFSKRNSTPFPKCTSNSLLCRRVANSQMPPENRKGRIIYVLKGRDPGCLFQELSQCLTSALALVLTDLFLHQYSISFL